jgi:predicted glycoside hydrolase/deacetylase ChbG (UPF0249 family)
MGAWRLKRRLIVNADDFGQSHGLNRGIIAAHENGIVTSASLMVRWPAAREAAAYAVRHPELSLGLHFDFGEWVCENNTWRILYEVVPQDNARAVAQEANRQLTMFKKLVGRDPTHLDSHQHTHRNRTLRPMFEELSSILGVPLRGRDRRVRYIGNFYGQSTAGRSHRALIGTRALLKIIGELRPGFTELGCHPGYASDLQSMYKDERQREVETLCDARVRSYIIHMDIQLSSFHDLAEKPTRQPIARRISFATSTCDRDGE